MMGLILALPTRPAYCTDTMLIGLTSGPRCVQAATDDPFKGSLSCDMQGSCDTSSTRGHHYDIGIQQRLADVEAKIS